MIKCLFLFILFISSCSVFTSLIIHDNFNNCNVNPNDCNDNDNVYLFWEGPKPYYFNCTINLLKRQKYNIFIYSNSLEKEINVSYNIINYDFKQIMQGRIKNTTIFTKIYHISDLMRMYIVDTHSKGYYLDFDMLVLNKLQCLDIYFQCSDILDLYPHYPNFGVICIERFKEVVPKYFEYINSINLYDEECEACYGPLFNFLYHCVYNYKIEYKKFTGFYHGLFGSMVMNKDLINFKRDIILGSSEKNKEWLDFILKTHITLHLGSSWRPNSIENDMLINYICSIAS
jgi:hypothetical protein